MGPIVSWLMPVYNAEKYVRRALDSMLAQSMQDFELLIVMEPDCQDHTEDICREYASKDPRICVIKNGTRQGIAKSLNIGLEAARGKYIARMDADDYSYPQRLEKQVSYMDAHEDIGILCTNRRVICDNGTTYQSDHPTDPEEISAGLLFGFYLNHPSMMLRADLFREHGWRYPTEREAEDFGLCAELVKYMRIGCLEEVLLDYYEHGDNAIFSKFDAVRKASAWISRNAIRERLGVQSVGQYDDIYFGWREQDYPLGGLEDYLKTGYRLFREVYLKNEEKGVIDKKVFRSEINHQWKVTTDISGMGFFMPEVDFTEYVKDDSLDDEIEAAVQKFSDIFSCEKKVAIWGTGVYCRKILQDIAGNYPFWLCAFIDSNVNKAGGLFLDVPVISPDRIEDTGCEYIGIASNLYKDEIFQTLTEDIGFPEKNIFILPDAKKLGLLIERSRVR